ncbi:MAG: hypothetical protein ACO3QM_06370 [Candidatus Nanopelagicaceae bacterium]
MTEIFDEPTAIVPVEPQPAAVFNPVSGTTAFDLAQRMSKALASSDLVPDAFRGNVANCLIALEISTRLNMAPLMVMQNLHIIHGRPSWSSQFIIAAINSSRRFTTLKFEFNKDRTSCTAYATERATGEVIRGATVTLEMASVEGWSTKKGSKWATMPELMLQYRAAAFFGRVYCPEILNGLYSEQEAMDIATTNAQD